MTDFQLASGRAKRPSVPATSHDTAGFVLPDGTRFTVGNTISLTAGEIASPTAEILADTSATYIGPNGIRYVTTGAVLVPFLLDATGSTVTVDPTFSGAANSATSTAYLQAIINAASAAFATNTYRIRVAFPPSLWFIDGLVVKPNVWIDFGEAYFKKNADGTGNTFGENGSSTQAMLRTQDSLVGGSTYYGNYDNIRVSGGWWDMQDKAVGGAIFMMVNLRNSVIENSRLLRSGTDLYWSTMLGGQNLEINNISINGGTIQGQDGLHIVHGQDIRVTGGSFIAGDDAIAIGCDAFGAGASTALLFDDEVIQRISIVNPYVKSLAASALKLYYEAPWSGSNRHKIDGVTVLGLHGQAGITTNPGISIKDTSATDSQDPSRIKNVKIVCDLTVGSASHDGGVAAGVIVYAAQDWEISGCVRIIDTTGGATRFKLAELSHSVRGRLNVDCPQLPANDGIDVINLSTSVQLTRDNTISGRLVAGTGTLWHVGIGNAPNTTIENSQLLGIQTNNPGVRMLPSALTVSSLKIIGTTFAKAAAATSTIGYNSITTGRINNLQIVGCDFADVALAVDSALATNCPVYKLAGNINLASFDEQSQLFTPAGGGTVTIDTNLGLNARVTFPAGNITIAAPLNPSITQRLTINLIQDGTGGRTITWNAAFKKAADGAGGANGRGCTAYVYDGTNWVQQGGALAYF